jgi:predicted ATPase
VTAVPLPDGRVLLASGSVDGTVRLWEVVREDRVQQVPRYVSDTAADRDLLDRDREAVAIADLLTARSARPPLAFGVFGQWGEGKTQFLDLVYRAVAARSAAAASEAAAGREDPIAHPYVRQVRFNA